MDCNNCHHTVHDDLMFCELCGSEQYEPLLAQPLRSIEKDMQ
jgi:rRNA maturation endonuclease Nob1